MIRSIAESDDDIIDTEDATKQELKELKARYKQPWLEHHELKSKLDSDSKHGY